VLAETSSSLNEGSIDPRQIDPRALTSPIACCSLSLVSAGTERTVWQRWVRQPKTLWLRRALFQLHLWSGIALGLYILMMSVTGSVLVYSNELFTAATPEPIISTGPEPRLTDDQLEEAARRLYPDYQVAKIGRARNLDQAVIIWLHRSNGDAARQRLFDPRTGRDLGDSVPTGIWLVSKLIDLHDNLLAGPTGRKVNALGALALLVLVITGLAIWWPGIRTWRRSLTLPRDVRASRGGWKRINWHLHSMIGFWSLGFIMVFAVSGAYLGYPQPFHDLSDRLEPITAANAGLRIGDRIIYWLAFLHFGRINGIGIPCSGPGFCDQTTKAVWAIFGLAPAVMFVTGGLMWWNRVLRPRPDRVKTSRAPFPEEGGRAQSS
jgi:uncharacterized iron-regulated membrane protein